MRLLHFWRFLPVLSWFAVAGVGGYFFADLQGIGDFATDGTPRSTLDKAFPYLFLLLVPYGLWMACKEFLEAREAIPLAEAEAEKARQRRQRHKAARAELANRPPLDDSIKQDALETLNLLRAAGVIGAAEVEDAAFLGLCEVYYLESGDLYEVSGILALYAETYGDFANALLIPDQVEVAAPDIVEMIEGFARLAGRLGDLGTIAVEFSNHRKRGSDGIARFELGGAVQALAFEYHGKNASGGLMEALDALFDPQPPYRVAYFDSIYLVTCLRESECAKLNAMSDPDYKTFQSL